MVEIHFFFLIEITLIENKMCNKITGKTLKIAQLKKKQQKVCLQNDRRIEMLKWITRWIPDDQLQRNVDK